MIATPSFVETKTADMRSLVGCMFIRVVENARLARLCRLCITPAPVSAPPKPHRSVDMQTLQIVTATPRATPRSASNNTICSSISSRSRGDSGPKTARGQAQSRSSAVIAMLRNMSKRTLPSTGDPGRSSPVLTNETRDCVAVAPGSTADTAATPRRRSRVRERLRSTSGSGSGYLKKFREQLRAPVANVKNHIGFTLNLLMGAILFFGSLTTFWHAVLAHAFSILLGDQFTRSWFLVVPAAVGFTVTLLVLGYTACFIKGIDDDALVSVVRQAIGVDEEELRHLAATMADNLEAYKKLSAQIDAALAAYKRTAEGAGKVVEVGQRLAGNIASNHPDDFETDEQRAPMVNSTYNKVFSAVSHMRHALELAASLGSSEESLRLERGDGDDGGSDDPDLEAGGQKKGEAKAGEAKLEATATGHHATGGGGNGEGDLEEGRYHTSSVDSRLTETAAAATATAAVVQLPPPTTAAEREAQRVADARAEKAEAVAEAKVAFVRELSQLVRELKRWSEDGATPEQELQAAGWLEATDAATGRVYYYHEESRAVQWHRPKPQQAAAALPAPPPPPPMLMLTPTPTPTPTPREGSLARVTERESSSSGRAMAPRS